MARRGSSRRGVRDAFHIARDPLLEDGFLPAPTAKLRLATVTLPEVFDQALGQVEDLRRFNPTRSVSPLATVSGAKARADKVVGRAMEHVGFRTPDFVVVCVRRKERREVIFAKRKRRKGAGASRRRFNFWSQVRC